MPKKYHKLYGHREKHSSRIRTQRKVKKEHVVSQSLLEPIQEVSKEKLRIDKNACGDFLHSSVLRTQLAHNKEKKPGRSRNKQIKHGEDNQFDKDKVELGEKPIKKESVRHQSLEKNENSLLNKTRFLFRKEKSFNDAISKTIDSKNDKIDVSAPKKERKRKHRHKETDNIKNKERKFKEATIEPIIENNPNQVAKKQHSSLKIKRKRHKSEKRRHKSTEKSPQFNKQLLNRVQEVIFCHTNQVPYKMKNDRSASEVKDLYRRIKREKRHVEENKREHRSHSRGDSKQNYGPKPDKYLESFFSHTEHHRSNSRNTKEQERFKGPEHVKHNEIIGKERIHLQLLDFDRPEKHVEKPIKKRDEQKHSQDLSEISLGPYENYFSFEKRYHSDYCKKHHRKQHTTHSEDRKYQQNNREENDHKPRKKSQENGENVHNPRKRSQEDDQKHRKKSQEKDEKHRRKSQEREEPEKEPPKIEEAKIHQIVEGDLKNYFHKIQAMIDNKLDVILQLNKEKREARKKEKELRESRKRSRSKPKESPTRKNADKGEKRKEKSPDKKDKDVTKEEIVNEVLRRLKEKELRESKPERKLKPHTSKTEVLKPQRTAHESHVNNRIDHQEMTHKSHIAKIDSSKDSCQSKNINVCSSWKSSESKNLDDQTVAHTRVSRRSKERSLSDTTGNHGVAKSHKHRHHHISKADGYDSVNRFGTNKHPDKLQMAKDSLEYTRNRCDPPRELVIPVENICSIPKRKNVSSSSCKTSRNRRHHHRQMYSASDETIWANYHEERLKTSSPERYLGRADEKKSKIPTNDKPEPFTQNTFKKYLCSSPPRYHSKYNISTQEPFLEELFMPPESFRQPLDVLYNEHLASKQRHQFIVQGIEPPILECPTKAPKRTLLSRNLECKTVSIIGIQPQVDVKELTAINQTQTSSRSQKSSVTERDLVERRKKSKRFKLYYKYSVVDNAQGQNGDSSDAKSIVSDSYRVMSDPSEEYIVDKEYKRKTKPKVDAEAPQIAHPVPLKKWNRISTPRDSHLNNIIEEPSNMSTSLQDQDYFVALHGTREYYCRALSSSHSDYCFKIDKKPANSNISLQSKDAWDDRYIVYEGRKCRYYRTALRSRSDMKLVTRIDGNYLPRSRSDVFLDGNKGKQIFRSIFLDDSHPFARNTNLKPPPKQKQKQAMQCKDCQTIEILQVNEFYNDEIDKVVTEEVFEDKQKQFAEIYKTIDNLEKNIHSSQRVSPKTVDTAVGSASCLSKEVVSKKEDHMATMHRTTDILKDVVIQTADVIVRTVDAAIGSPIKSKREERPKTRTAKKQIHVAVGNSEIKVPLKSESPRRKVQKPQSKDIKQHNKSAAVSPIRVIEEAGTQLPSKSPTRKVITPQTQRTRQFVSRSAGQKIPKNTPETSPCGVSVPKDVEIKEEQSAELVSITAQSTHPKSANKPKVYSKERNQALSKYSAQKQCIKVFRSAEKNSNLRSQVPDVHDISGPSKEPDASSTNPPSELVMSCQESKELAPHRGTANKEKPWRKSVPKPLHDKVDDSCFLHSPPKKSRSPSPAKSIPMSPNGKPVIINTATCNQQSSVKAKATKTESSTSSSVLSDVVPQIVRKSKSLVEMRSIKDDLSKSKSDICCSLISHKDDYLGTKEGSLLSNMEKFTNEPILRCAGSKSHGTSLDHYIRNKFISRLFLTKDYKGAAISAYQKRKLYDQTIRQKMKKKFKFSKIDVGPQIFEVRFLSMVNQVDKEGKRVDSKIEEPVISLNLGRVPESRKRYHSRQNSCFASTPRVNKLSNFKTKAINENADDLKVQERNLIFDSVNDAVQDNHSNNVTKNAASSRLDDKNSITTILQAKSVAQAPPGVAVDIRQEKLINFVKKMIDMNSIFNEEMFKNTECSCKTFSQDCSACRNFINLMTRLHASLTNYCKSKSKQESHVDNHKELEEFEVYLKHNHGMIDESTTFIEKVEAKYELDLSVPISKSLKVEELFPVSQNKISSDSTQSTEPSRHHFENPVDCLSLDTVQQTESPILLQPMSCPVLATNTSSFDFLYEEAISLDNETFSQDTIIANLTRPFDQTFNFSTRQYNVETPFFRENWESTSGSVESGYASIKSKSCCANSLTNFFKKPSIAALFKPPVVALRKTDLSKMQEPCGEGKLTRNIIYKEMTEKCKLYAKKVRQRSEMNPEQNIGEYQEFSLKLLLGKDSAVVLESKSLSVRSIGDDLNDIAKDIEGGVEKELVANPHEAEESCFELTSTASSQEDINKSSKSYSQHGCKLILSNRCLNIENIIYLGPEVFAKNNFSNTKLEELCGQESTFTLDFSLDSNNPFISNSDTGTNKFLVSLIKMYEREMEICCKLYHDDLFENILLTAIKKHRNDKRKNKKSRFCKLFRKKPPDDGQKLVEGNDFQNDEDVQNKTSTRLQNLASKARKCFNMLAEAVKINGNIDKELKICGLLRLLERIESGDFILKQINENANREEELRSQITTAFINIYDFCQMQTKKYKKRVTAAEIKLIKLFVTKYRVGLLSETDIVVSRISRGIIQTENQLKESVVIETMDSNH